MNPEHFEWDEGGEDSILADESLCTIVEIFAMTCSQSAASKRSPPPPTKAQPASRLPDIGILTANILASRDTLFFVTHIIPGSDVSERALVRIDLQVPIQAHSAVLQDERFLAQFYTCHPADKRYNAVN